MNTQKLNIDTAVAKAGTSFAARPILFVIFTALTGIVAGAATHLDNHGFFEKISPALGIVIVIALTLLLLFFAIMTTMIALETLAHKNTSVKNLLTKAASRSISTIIPVIGVSILVFITMVPFMYLGVYAFVKLWIPALLLFGIPGIFFGVNFAFAPFLVIDQKKGPLDAMRTSWRITKSRRWNTLALLIIAGIISWLGYLVFGYGALITYPIGLLVFAAGYRMVATSGTSHSTSENHHHH